MYLFFNVLGVVTNAVRNYIDLKKTLPQKENLIINLLETIGLIIGSKIVDIFINFTSYHSISEIITTGYMFYGGLLYSFLGVLLYCSIQNINLKIMDTLIPNVLLLFGICKLGCFFNSCCLGIYHFPISLVESISSIILYFILLKNSKRVFYSCLFFGSMRFITFFFRMDQSNFIFQEFISILIIFIGFFYQNQKKHCSYLQ